jgi:hypothetical protein
MSSKLGVLELLLWAFDNTKSELCFSSYERIAEGTHCARPTVDKAIKALEDWVFSLGRSGELASTSWGNNAWRRRMRE